MRLVMNDFLVCAGDKGDDKDDDKGDGKDDKGDDRDDKSDDKPNEMCASMAEGVCSHRVHVRVAG